MLIQHSSLFLQLHNHNNKISRDKISLFHITNKKIDKDIVQTKYDCCRI